MEENYLRKNPNLEKLKKDIQNRRFANLGVSPESPEGFDNEDYRFLITLYSELACVTEVPNRVMRFPGKPAPLFRPQKFFRKDRTLNKKELEKILELSQKYELPIKEDGNLVSVYFTKAYYPGINPECKCILEFEKNQMPDSSDNFFSFIRGQKNQELLEFYNSF